MTPGRGGVQPTAQRQRPAGLQMFQFPCLSDENIQGRLLPTGLKCIHRHLEVLLGLTCSGRAHGNP